MATIGEGHGVEQDYEVAATVIRKIVKATI
jgi:hypothetical protein